MFFFIFLFSFKLSSFALNLFLFSYFLTGQNMENAQLTPQKYAHLRLHLRKCSCFSRHDTLQNMRFDCASYSSQSNWSNQTSWKPEWVFPGVADEGFCYLCRLLRLIRRGRRRHRLCIISKVRFVGLIFRNAAFEERTLQHFEHK